VQEGTVKRANIAAAVIGMALSSGAYTVTLGFKKFRNVPVGPEFFPRWLAVGLFVCSGVLLFQALKTVVPAGGKTDEDKKSLTLSPRDAGVRRMLIGLGILLLYALSWNLLGFILATPLVLFAVTFLLGHRKIPVMAIFALAATAVIFCAFRFLLGIEMPLGVLDGLL
jgi:putative tricarboxylic transport membrane protein